MAARALNRRRPQHSLSDRSNASVRLLSNLSDQQHTLYLGTLPPPPKEDITSLAVCLLPIVIVGGGGGGGADINR